MARVMEKKFFLKILIAKMLGCFFAVYVFARFTPLSDAGRYIAAESTDSLLAAMVNRTAFTDWFFSALGNVLGRGDQLHFFTATLVALVIYYVFKDYARYVPRVFWLTLLLFSFAVWTSVVGKEALAFCGFLLMVKWVVEFLLRGRSNSIALLIGIFFGLVVRPHYFIVYFFMVVMTILFLGKNRVQVRHVRFSSGAHGVFFLTLFFLFVLGLVISFGWWELYLHELMQMSEHYFSLWENNASRTWIQWNSAADFFGNMWWGVPVALLGPTVAEVLERPIIFPFFVEGIVFVFLIVYFIFTSFRRYGQDSRIRFFLIYVFLPAVLGAILIFYPFGIFNAGSAVRYKQTLTPLFYFLPMLLMAGVSKACHEREIGGG